MAKNANPLLELLKMKSKTTNLIIQTYKIASNVGNNDCDAQIALEEIRMLIEKWTKEIL